MNEFLQRLRERKLVQWALAYVAASFALIQVIDIVAQRFSWPEQTMRFVIIALAIGFFVTLVLAWYHGERGAQRVTGTELLILALLLAIGGVVVWRLAPTSEQVATAREAPGTKSTSSAPVDRKSVAVLPFESLSKDEDNAYFAGGMQDMILTKLAGIGDLKVISRTSTEKYKSHPDNLKTIAAELGVATLLEGSVQKSGNQVLINVQLIDAATDNHIWADAYPRTLENIFGVEGEVAQKVAEALHSALTHDERTALARKPTENAAAYEAYLRAQALGTSFDSTLPEIEAALQTAVTLDPNFTLAWADLVRQHLRAYWFGFDPTQARLAWAKAALDKAVALAPDLPQVEMARAEYLYWAQRDMTGALAVMQKVQSSLPNDALVWFVTAAVERRLGKWDDSVTHQQHAQALDPKDPGIRYDVILTFLVQHRFTEAARLLDAELAATPDFWGLLELKLYAEWNLGGPDAGGRMLAPLTAQTPETDGLRGQLALFRRDFKSASKLFDHASTASDDVRSEWFAGSYLPANIGWSLQHALSEQRGGSPATAAEIYRRVQALASTALAAKPANPNVEASWHAVLGLANAGLGERDQAVAAGQRAVDLIPESKDAFEGPYWLDYLARIHAMNGDAAHALPLIQHLLQTYGSLITPVMLKLDPVWDPIRSDPGFQALLKLPTANGKDAAHG